MVTIYKAFVFNLVNMLSTNWKIGKGKPNEFK